MERVKNRLIKEYHIHFPVLEQRRKGMENEILSYERLPREIKKIQEMEYDKDNILVVKDSLLLGKTITGQSLKN